MYFSRGLTNLMKWSDLPNILDHDGKEILTLHNTGGVGLLESISDSLKCEYDIHISTDELISKIAQEILQNPDYTRYMRVPISQEEVNYRLLSFKQGDKYALLLSQVYIPAISSALDIHLRIIQNVGGYYTVLNAFPLPSTQVNIMDVKKTVTLILVDGIYKPVVPKKCALEQQDQQVPVPEAKYDSEEKKRKIEYSEEKGKEIGLPQTECKSPEKKKRKIEEEKEDY